MKEAWILCDVRPGVFDDERVVSVQTVGGPFEFVTDVSSVTVEPGRDSGAVQVWYVGESEDVAKVLVPGSGGSDSRVVVVPKSNVREISAA